MIRNCVICGKEFKCSPSDKIVTCSKECRSERVRRANKAKKKIWSPEARAKISAKGITPNLKKGTAAALKSPIAGSFETNQEALTWTIKSPDGVVYKVTNLRLFIKDNPDLFDGTVDQATHGFYAIKQAMLGKRTNVTQWKGWELINWEEPCT